MRLIDTHCHLVSAKLRSRWEGLLETAREAGVERILNVAYDCESIAVALEQVSIHPELYALIGIQPHDAKEYTPDIAEQICIQSKDNQKVVGIGEIGLDGHYTLSPMFKQIECYRHFLEIAKRISLPVAVHMREAFADVLAGIRETPGVKGVIHCFTGDREQAKAFLDAGFLISLSGIVTFKNSRDLQEVARFIPEDRLLLETDAPYLAPEPHRGRLNVPAYLRQTCESVAALRGIAADNLAESTWQNAHRLFSRLS